MLGAMATTETVSVRWYCRCGKQGAVAVERGHLSDLYGVILWAHRRPYVRHAIITELSLSFELRQVKPRAYR